MTDSDRGESDTTDRKRAKRTYREESAEDQSTGASTDSPDAENRTALRSRSGAVAAGKTTASGGEERGFETYDPGPNGQRLSERYDLSIHCSSQAERVQRLSSEFSDAQVSRWVDEGMSVEAMGKPRDMAAFRDRNRKRPGAVPDDIERKNRASAHRSNRAARQKPPAGRTETPDTVRRAVATPGRSMEESIQREMESNMGGDFSDVQIHTGPRAAAAAESLGARAFTVGRNVAFAKGEYRPDSPDGKKVLAHELTHVQQQTEGVVSLLPKPEASYPGGRTADAAYHIQPKLEVSSPDDPAEKEAEQVAEQVVEMDEPTASSTRGVADGPDRRAWEPGLLGAAPVRRSSGGPTVSSEGESQVRTGVQGDGKNLPSETRSEMESKLGADFSDVSVHTGPEANAAAESINAEAYTMGSNIAFAEGTYNPGSKSGSKLLAHELTHVAQQTGGASRSGGSLAHREDGGGTGDPGGGRRVTEIGMDHGPGPAVARRVARTRLSVFSAPVVHRKASYESDTETEYDADYEDGEVSGSKTETKSEAIEGEDASYSREQSEKKEVSGSSEGVGYSETETDKAEHETEEGTITSEEKEKRSVEVGEDGVKGESSSSSKTEFESEEGSVTKEQESKASAGVDSEGASAEYSTGETEQVESDGRTETRERERSVEGSVTGEEASAGASTSDSWSVEGEDHKIETGVDTAVNGLVSWEVQELEDGGEESKYEFALSIGLSGQIGASGDGEYEFNQDDEALSGSPGSVSGGAEAGVSGGMEYTQTRIFGEEEAARYQSHLNAIERTHGEALLDAADWPEFDIVAKAKMIMDTSPEKLLGGMSGVMGDPSAVDLLEEGESFSLTTSGGWNVSVEGAGEVTQGGIGLGVGASASQESNWENVVEIERVTEQSEEEITGKVGQPKEPETVLEQDLHFDTGKSDPFTGPYNSENRTSIQELAQTLSDLSSYGRPEIVNIDVTGHASQRWKAAEDAPERKAKNQQLSAERAQQTAAIIRQKYNQLGLEAWPTPEVDAKGSVEAREDPESGGDPSTDKKEYRRSDVSIEIGKLQPDPSHSGKIRIKVGFSEATKSEGSGNFSVGAASGGVSASKAESSDITSTFEIYETIDYFDDLYESLVTVSSPEELHELQQDEMYYKHWVGSDVAQSVRNKLGPDFSVGGAKVSIRYGGFSEGSWTVTPDGIQAGEAKGGQQVGGTISFKDYDVVNLPEETTQAKIRKTPEGFDVDVSQIYSWQQEALEGFIISPEELQTFALRAGNEDFFMRKYVGAPQYRHYWAEFREKLVNPELPADLKETAPELEDQWQKFQRDAQKDPDEREFQITKIREEFEDAVRANAFRWVGNQLGSTAKGAIKRVLFAWEYGGEEGLKFEFPGGMEDKRQEFKDIRHVRVPQFSRKAQQHLGEMEPGEEFGQTIDEGKKLLDDIDQLRSTVIEYESQMDSDPWSSMLSELNELKSAVREQKNALLQISDTEGEEGRDYGAETLWMNINDNVELIRRHKNRFEQAVVEAKEKWTGGHSYEVIITDNDFYEEWGALVDEMEELLQSNPDAEIETLEGYAEKYHRGNMARYNGDPDKWATFEKYVDEHHPPGLSIDPEKYRNMFGHGPDL